MRTSTPIVLAALVAVVSACTVVMRDGEAPRASKPAPAAAPARAAAPAPASAAGDDYSTTPDAFDDPFAYCAAVGTIDAPDDRWVGPQMPVAIAQGLQRAFHVPPTAPLDPFLEHSVWRCMQGQVYACNFGANLPCQSQADLSRVPSTAMDVFCRQHPGADTIPAVYTGRATVWDWRCRDTTPTPERQLLAVDPEGFIAGIWYAIAPPDPAVTAP